MTRRAKNASQASDLAVGLGVPTARFPNGLSLEETDLARGSTWIKGKGRKEKELVPLPAAVVEAIRRYLAYRGRVPGPLVQTRGQRRGKNRNGGLETRSVLRIVRELGQRAGLGLDKIRAHSRHRSIATLMLYVDEHDRQRTQTTLADLVASTLTA